MESKPGILGLIASGVAYVISLAQKYDAELRAVWLLLSIVIALMTLAWWVRKWWRSFTKSADKLEE